MKYNFQGRGYTTLTSCYENNKDKITVTIHTVKNRLKKEWTLKDALLLPKEKTVTTKLGQHAVENTVYENLPSIAKEYGMSLNTVYKRYSRGYRGDDLVPLKKRKTYSAPIEKVKYRFFAGGIGYKSEADACRKLGVKYGTYRNRKRNGFTIEQALGIDIIKDGREARGKEFELDGKLSKINELSQLFQVSEVTIRNRLIRGATIRQAIGIDEIPRNSLISQSKLVKKKRSPIKFIVDGKTFNSYQSLANEYDLPQYVVRQRIVDYRYSPEDAVKLDGKSKPVTVQGVDYPSKAALAEAYGLTLDILLARLANGTTIEQAIGIEIKETSRTVNYDGDVFSSITDLAEKKGISAATIGARIRSGLSLKEAIEAGEKIRNSGRYNLTILERDSNLANKDGWLYFVKIMIEDQVRYKIGITTQNVNARLKQEGYEFETLKVIEGTLMDCFTLEQALIDLLSDQRDPDVTSDMLDGYSEIFNLDESDIQVIMGLLGN